jgi:hypothetical protein
MTKEQKETWNIAYNHGYETGLIDKVLGVHSDYAMNGIFVEPPTSYSHAYSKGYRHAILHTRVPSADDKEPARA